MKTKPSDRYPDAPDWGKQIIDDLAMLKEAGGHMSCNFATYEEFAAFRQEMERISEVRAAKMFNPPKLDGAGSRSGQGKDSPPLAHPAPN